MWTIHRSFDWFDAHVIVARLRAEGIDAQVFDANFVRQDWFKILLFRGFRVVVPEESIVAANEIMSDFKNGALQLEGEHRLTCPKCGAESGIDDPVPRRVAFAAIFGFEFLLGGIFFFLSESATGFIAALVGTFVFFVALPFAAIRYFKWRYRCDVCRNRWRESPAYTYLELTAMVENESPMR